MASLPEIDFSLRIDSGTSLVDMDYALETMSGFSAALSIITDSVLSTSVPANRGAADDVRAQLMGAYLGSYVQNFKLRINDAAKIAKLNSLGSSVVSELISYFISESVYIEPAKLSKAAERRLAIIEPNENKIIDRIHESVKDMHKISKMKGYTVTLKRKVNVREMNVIQINKSTSENIFNISEDDNFSDISAMVTRFNSFTGNGRILLDGNVSTIPFGFIGSYSRVRAFSKRLVSQNLHDNTAINTDARTSLIFTVKAKRNMSNEVIKYLIRDVTKP
ncbi:hypothetical protein [Rahnella aceris]|uniref:hypothetical protein n=1 Tax=Rahnella sp. (strain Y9602) TaxID=2703885 RepID=UPI003FD4468D